MRLFTIKLSVFLLSFITILFLFILIIDFKVEKLQNSGNKNFNDIETLILGDSHIKYALNDFGLKKTINLAQESESYYHTYFKLKTLLRKTSKINKVYLGLGYHSFSLDYENYIKGEKSHMIYPKYFFSLSQKEKIINLLNTSPKFLISNFKKIIKLGLLQILNDNFLFQLGGFGNSFNDTKVNLIDVQNRINQQFIIANGVSSIQKSYLNKIVNLCASRNLELIFINTPNSIYYNEKIPLEFRNNVENYIKHLDIRYIDYSKWELPHEAFLPDGDHLSKLGAQVFTQEFIKTENLK